MKRLSFSNRDDRGMAIISVVLVVALALALFVMAFTNSMVGKFVTETHRTARTVAECSHGDLALANQILMQMTSPGELPSLPGWVTPNANLVAEIGGDASLAGDNVNTPPANLTITNNPAYPACVTSVDVDYLFRDKGGDGTAAAGNDGYHSAGAGTLCEPGDFYSITAVTIMGGVSSTVESVFCKPPIS